MGMFLHQEVDQTVMPVEFNALASYLGGASIQSAMRQVGEACGIAEEELQALVPVRD